MMFAALAPTLFLLGGVAADLSPYPSSSRTLRAEPAAVEVGEPFSLVLEVEHPADQSGTALTAGELTLDDSWFLLGTRFTPATAEPAHAERRVSRRIWDVVSLEPGSRELAVFGLVALSADDPGEERVTVEVRGVLAADEDAPRPLRGFPPTFGRDAEPALLSPWVKAAAVLGVLFAGVPWLLAARTWRRHRRGRGTSADHRLDPLARLETLRHEGAAAPGRWRDGYYELSRLLREETDRHLGRDRSGLTDEEWIAEVEGDLGARKELRADLGFALGACTHVKYAGESPSSFAVEETFSGARRVLEALTPVSTGEEGKS